MVDVIQNVIQVATILMTLGTNQLNPDVVQEHLEYINRPTVKVETIEEIEIIEEAEPEISFQAYTNTEYHLASIIEGEAPFEDCGFEAQLAVAHVYSRNKRMNGYRTPSDNALYVARNWYNYNDNTGGSYYIMSSQDVKLASVRELTGYPYSEYWTFYCDGNDLIVFPQ